MADGKGEDEAELSEAERMGEPLRDGARREREIQRESREGVRRK